MKDRESITTNGRAVFYAAIWDDLRQSALDRGWALALHGSLKSDMDIMAMPWVENAAPVEDMIIGLKGCFTDADCIAIEVSQKPNNRVVYTLSIWADFYLDINVIGNDKDRLFKIEKDDVIEDPFVKMDLRFNKLNTMLETVRQSYINYITPPYRRKKN